MARDRLSRYTHGGYQNTYGWHAGGTYPTGILSCTFVFTFTDPYSNSSPDSDPIPLLGSWDWNLNLTMCSVKSSTYYNVAVWFAVRIRI